MNSSRANDRREGLCVFVYVCVSCVCICVCVRLVRMCVVLAWRPWPGSAKTAKTSINSICVEKEGMLQVLGQQTRLYTYYGFS